MKVTFRVRLDQDQLLDESQLRDTTDSEQAKLAATSAFQGVLELTDDGVPAVLIEDEIEAWVQNLCYDAVPRVLGGESFEILYFSYAGRVGLEPSGPGVTVRGDYIETAHFPIGTLLPALVSCGDRFVDWARKAKAEDASYLANLEYIAGFRPRALTALISAGLPGPER
jgi:hypothetical protein